MRKIVTGALVGVMIAGCVGVGAMVGKIKGAESESNSTPSSVVQKTTDSERFSSDSVIPDIIVGVPMRQRDFAVLSEKWRMALSADFESGGKTLRPKGCASYSRVTKNNAFPAQCYEVLYRARDGVHVIMPVTAPIIALRNIHKSGDKITAEITYAQCHAQDAAGHGGCFVQPPVEVTMNTPYYTTLSGLAKIVSGQT